LQVQVAGTVNMCCFDYDGKLTFGDLKTQSLKEVFETQAFKKIHHCHTTGDYKGSGLLCENCDQLNADKSDVMVYSTKFDDLRERVRLTSTAYSKLL
ncbi:MAG: SPASM domain-containing protein, partial [Candidatus Omnitrophica bacterium]|nr:SPASM domain-containing protein [Candidatus Omnitrophota bacterium]